MPALVPENLRHHDIPCAMATPSVNGRSSQVVHLAERAGLAHIRNRLGAGLTAAQ